MTLVKNFRCEKPVDVLCKPWRMIFAVKYRRSASETHIRSESLIQVPMTIREAIATILAGSRLRFHSQIASSRSQIICDLTARLALRAGDVSALKFGDLLWGEGTLIISGKSRRQTRLPLPQVPTGSRRGGLVLSETCSTTRRQRSHLYHSDRPIRPNFSSVGGEDRISRMTPYRHQCTHPRR